MSNGPLADQATLTKNTRLTTVASMSLPAIKSVPGASQAQRGAAQATVSGLAPLLSALSRATDLLLHDDIGLHNFLNFRVAVAYQASQRRRWFGGRIYNKLAGEEADYIPISGAHLEQTLSVVGLTTPEFVAASEQYLLRVDYAKGAIDVLAKNIATNVQD